MGGWGARLPHEAPSANFLPVAHLAIPKGTSKWLRLPKRTCRPATLDGRCPNCLLCRASGSGSKAGRGCDTPPLFVEMADAGSLPFAELAPSRPLPAFPGGAPGTKRAFPVAGRAAAKSCTARAPSQPKLSAARSSQCSCRRGGAFARSPAAFPGTAPPPPLWGRCGSGKTLRSPETGGERRPMPEAERPALTLAGQRQPGKRGAGGAAAPDRPGERVPQRPPLALGEKGRNAAAL
uniref:Uncharacterized protein n=1 Tax=Sphaerodactylus townsendi TaxID=933632 RepID=A0ACB8FQ06_9SAUR